MTHHDTKTMNKIQSDLAGTYAGASPLILLSAPSHDDLTEYTSSLFESFPSLGVPAELRVFERPLTYEQLLSEISVDPETTDVALIFCGHGEPSALLGPGIQKKTFSTFYDDTIIEIRPKYMLAFCCKSAAGIGRSYKHKTEVSTFVGFGVDIGIVTVSGVYAAWWRKILYGLVSAMLNSPDGYALEKSVQSLYQEAIAFFHRNDKKYRWARAMKWYLITQSKSVKVIQT